MPAIAALAMPLPDIAVPEAEFLAWQAQQLEQWRAARAAALAAAERAAAVAAAAAEAEAAAHAAAVAARAEVLAIKPYQPVHGMRQAGGRLAPRAEIVRPRYGGEAPTDEQARVLSGLLPEAPATFGAASTPLGRPTFGLVAGVPGTGLSGVS